MEPPPAGPLSLLDLLALPEEERRPALERDLQARVGPLLQLPAVQPGQPLTALGLDSLAAVELQHGIESDLGVAPDLADLLSGWSIADLAREVLAGLARNGSAVRPRGLGESEAGDHPLSAGQRGLWFLDRLSPDSATYNIVATARVTGALDAAALKRALLALVERHPALRTTFHEIAGEPLRRVAERGSVDLSALDATSRREAEMAACLAARGYQPFDLENGPLLRLRLLRHSAQEHVVLFAVHHLVTDFWSLAVMVRELGALYAEARGGPPAGLPALPATYTDYTTSREALLAGPEGELQWRFWREALAGDLPPLDLPADRPRPPEPTHRAVAAALPAPVDLSALRDLARRRGATLYMALLAAFDVLLLRYTGQEDLLVGSPTAGRSAAAWAGLVGFFVNTLVLRADASGDPPFVELLDRARKTALAAFAHPDLPFPLLAERLRTAREGDRSPLVQALFALEKGERAGEEPLAAFALGLGGARFALADLTVESLPLPERRAQFDLTLTAAELGGGLAGVFELDADRFDPTTAQRLAGHFSTLLAGIAANPAARLGSLPLLTAPERAELLTEWNATAAVFPGEGLSPAERFARQARRTPDAAAVVRGSEHLTFGELDSRADRLAHRLADRGAGPEVPVGFALDRSPLAVVAILATWKAGGIPLPLDPAGAAERTAFILEDAGAALLLTRNLFLPRLSAPCPVLCLDDPAALPASAGPFPPLDAEPDGLVYLLYTSGSTGEPKGTLLRRGSALNLLEAIRATCLADLPGPLGVGLIAAWTFDPALEQVLHLLLGNTLYLLSDDARRDGAALKADLARHPRLDTLDATPSQLRLWLEAGLLDDPARVPRTLLLGGEALDEPTWRILAAFSEVSATVAWNLYGPGECTVDSTGCRVSADLPGVRVGRPLPNVRAYVLDARLTPVPVGIPGEVCLAGAGLARGYLRRGDLTAERFVPDPWASEPGGRLYRSGDRARFAADGHLEFLGRVDFQVKLRGVRIEPGEIEAALRRHPGVAAAIVLARPAPGGDRRLVAYLEAAGVTAADLRASLAGRLPEILIPSAFVLLAALPLTPQGKIDRRALAALDLPAVSERGEPGRPPSGQVEELLSGIWQDLLGGVPPGRDDGFFDLGGHSLLATRLLARVRTAFGVDLPLADLFAAPTLSGFAARIEAALREGTSGPPPLLPARREEPIPLSFAQRRLWFLDRLEPGSAAYNMPAAIRLAGDLRVPALAAALEGVVRRHEALRTSFVPRGDEPVQRSAPPGDLRLPLVDLTGVEGEAARLQGEEARAPFDLARGPLYRFRLLRLGPGEHVLLLTLHHAVADGESLEILARELSALYVSAPLPPLPVQYADWALWQRRWAAGEEALAWWREALAGAPTDLPLPTDRPHPAMASGDGAVRSSALAGSLLPALAELARTERATLFMALSAGFAALLSRLAGADELRDLLVGTPVGNRRAPEAHGLIGFFVNTLPLRFQLSGRPGFRALLARTRAAVLGVHAHQDTPFERLVEALQAERASRRNPLFQVIFGLAEPPLAGLDLPGIEAELLPGVGGTAKFDLTLTVHRSGEDLSAELEYATDLFDATTVERWLRAFSTLLAGLVAEPEQPILEIGMLSPEERHQVRVEWNDTAVEIAEETLGESFLRQVERAPDAVALSCGDRQVSYGELARRSGRVAEELWREGGREETVALEMERSIELVVAMLGVVRAGGVYVPIDPEYPRERREKMIADSRASVILSGAKDLGGGVGLAYLIYTSGSTGEPKGVAVPHRAIQRLVLGPKYVQLSAADRVAHASTPSFDAATFEIWGALLNGARLEVFPPGPLSLAELGWEIRRSGVTVLWLTAGLFHPMVESHLEDLSGVRQLLAGGDVLSPAHVEKARLALPGCRLINGYGPTENTTFTCCHEIAEVDPGRPVPIGRPISGTTVSLLDAELQPVPIGVVGELCAGGLGLARGYWGDPAKTAERFVPDPHGEPGATGGRLYRTGDRVRWRPDGRIDFLGRLDRQVKIRGFRVEPGEVEAALARHPAVQEAVVDVRPDPAGGKRLVAWVVATAPMAVLRSHLEEIVPVPSVPSVFVPCSSLPLTPQGKIDRRALPEPEPAPASPQPALGTPFEELLAPIWCEVLGREALSPGDDFFALGGHSLLATRVISRVRAAFGVEIPLAALFEATTLAAFAARIESTFQTGRSTPVPPLVPRARTGDLPLSFAQERLWFLDQIEPESPFYNIAGAVRWTGPLAIPALAASLSAVLARHEALRTTFPAKDGAPLQLIHPPLPARLPEVDLSALRTPEAELRRLALTEAARPFDLAAGPLLRTTLLRLGPGGHAFLLTLHHIVGDGWSMAVLLREVAALYCAFLAGREPLLPPLPVQYADFALWQREWLSGEVLARELAHWRAALAGAPPVLDLPLDRPRPARQSFRGAEVACELPAPLVSSLAALARSQGATLFMTFLAAFAALLGRHTGQEDLALGTPIANRTRRETEGLIGFFVNTLVLRADLAGDPPFPELLARLRQRALAAYAHQDLPFERLVADLAPGRDLSHNPLFQALLSLEEPLLATAALPGLLSAPIDLPDLNAKFDLALVLSPRGDRSGGFRATLSYVRDLFDRTTILRLADHLANLLSGLARDPALPLSALPLLAVAEAHQLRSEWNDTATAPAPGECLHDVFAREASLHPDAIAVEMEGSHLSYAGLDARSTLLARHLRSLGVGGESPVAVFLERRPELLVSLFAISKAGGAYLPLSPAHPRQRLALLLAESAPAALLTEKRLEDRLPEHGARLVRFDERGAWGACPAVCALPSVSPGDLAYLLYTSGSTGEPKGVMIEHKNVAHLLRAIPGNLVTGQGDAVPSWTPVTFDLSLLEWLYALSTGGTVLLIPETQVFDLPALVATLARASALHCVPALLRQIVLYLAETGAPGPWASFRNVSAGGDSLDADLMAAAARVFPRATLRNLYGPTEITVLCTAHRVPRDLPPRGDVVGRPIPDTVIRLLDPAGNPVPIGVPGEIWVGGGGVGRGYFKSPALTAERFVLREGRRFFRTGDRARYLPDGTLLFLGRQDGQVKLRGLRVELGEIEAALLAQPGVAEAVAALWEDGGDPRLVAYVVPRPGERPDPAALRRALLTRLPEPVVPAAFVLLDALPRSAHGKVDRRALPAPERPRRERAAPRTSLEREIAAVWQEVLGTGEIGIDDNFFELGGTSLLLVRLRSRLEAALGRGVPVVSLFQYPTVRAFAESLPGESQPAATPDPRGQTRRESLARLHELRDRRRR